MPNRRPSLEPGRLFGRASAVARPRTEETVDRDEALRFWFREIGDLAQNDRLPPNLGRQGTYPSRCSILPRLICLLGSYLFGQDDRYGSCRFPQVILAKSFNIF